MKIVHFHQIRDAIAELCQRANFELNADVRAALETGAERETTPLAKNTLLRILKNADVAKERSLPMCQDTGLAVVFADVGQDVHIEGGVLRDAIDAGVRKGCKEGFLRASVTGDPIQRKNTGDNTPAVIHTAMVPGNQLRLQLLAKGGGCENMSRFKMLTPADGREGIVNFVVEAAELAGPNACPPIVVGVGIGGSFEYSAVLAKKSLLRKIGERNPLPHIAELEEEILRRVNASGIGPQGYGGETTALAVHIEIAACHVASLPVSVNIECHAHRHQEATL
ncbi:MAG: fumarate hydratase [Verrucomicrobia bacterium]|nr:fumarate hydratase [Verrucomicrobiota bacterium]